jgi:hypothetical protein
MSYKTPVNFSLCSRIWDENIDDYRSGTLTEVKNCCNNSCKSTIKECLFQCNSNFGLNGTSPDSDNYTRCTNACAHMIESCKRRCRLISPDLYGVNSLIIPCIKKYNCGDDKSCILNNKGDILECCHRSCKSRDNLSCDKYCEDQYDQYSGEYPKSSLIGVYADGLQNVNSKKTELINDNSWIYYIIVFFIVLIMGVIIYKLKKK